MPPKQKSPLVSDREDELLKCYKWNFDGLVHEFNLLHTRSGHYINMNWMLAAIYIPVLGVTLDKLGNQHLRQYACALLGVAAIGGLLVSAISMAGIYQAVDTIKRYLQNNGKIEEELGKDHAFLSAVSLGRTIGPTGNYREHESSLWFHRILPWFLVAIWVALAGFTVWLWFLPLPPPT